MEEKRLNDRIIDFLENSPSPMTLESISDEFLITQSRAKRSLDELRAGGKIIEYIPQNKNSGRKYYTVKVEKIGNIAETVANDIEKAVVQETVNVRDDYKDLSEKIEIIDKNVNGIYANIISIMSIFVAIFALITVNANIAFELTQQNLYDVFWGIVKINVFVVICITVLLLAVRIIIINPLIGKKRGRDKR